MERDEKRLEGSDINAILGEIDELIVKGFFLDEGHNSSPPNTINEETRIKTQLDSDPFNTSKTNKGFTEENNIKVVCSKKIPENRNYARV